MKKLYRLGLPLLCLALSLSGCSTVTDEETLAGAHEIVDTFTGTDYTSYTATLTGHIGDRVWNSDTQGACTFEGGVGLDYWYLYLYNQWMSANPEAYEDIELYSDWFDDGQDDGTISSYSDRFIEEIEGALVTFGEDSEDEETDAESDEERLIEGYGVSYLSYNHESDSWTRTNPVTGRCETEVDKPLASVYAEWFTGALEDGYITNLTGTTSAYTYSRTYEDRSLQTGSYTVTTIVAAPSGSVYDEWVADAIEDGSVTVSGTTYTYSDDSDQDNPISVEIPAPSDGEDADETEEEDYWVYYNTVDGTLEEIEAPDEYAGNTYVSVDEETMEWQFEDDPNEYADHYTTSSNANYQTSAALHLPMVINGDTLQYAFNGYSSHSFYANMTGSTSNVLRYNATSDGGIEFYVTNLSFSCLIYGITSEYRGDPISPYNPITINGRWNIHVYYDSTGLLVAEDLWISQTHSSELEGTAEVHVTYEFD